MVFSGVIFLFYFIPLFFIVYFLSPKKYRNLLLLAASILFYQWGAPWFVLVILASTFIDFHIVKKIASIEAKLSKKKWLILSLALNLGLLAWFKYANFFVDTVQNLFSTNSQWIEIALPIGISFYTFQTITYAVDVYRNVHAPLNKVSDYMMYILMFPQLIAGPIVRYHEIADQIPERKSRREDIEWGIVRFCIGLAKKVLIANVLAQNADEIFRIGAADMSTTTAWIGILAYTFQIYFDFSGYSDMAIGLGRILGFKFPENFNNPYTANSITDFWRRWHMTLGRFMKDYLYIPLGGNRLGKGRMYGNLVLVFLLSGLWHGASWNFVLWGVFHGMFLLLDRLFLLQFLNKIGKIPSILITFIITILGWVIFRIEDIHEASLFYKKLFDFSDIRSLYLYEKELWFTLLVAFIFSMITIFKFGQRAHDSVFNWSDIRPKFALKIIVIIGLSFSLVYILTDSFNPFIYFRF